MSLVIEPIAITERAALENLFQLYMHDLSEFVDLTLDDAGRYCYDFSKLNVYWQSPCHSPYFIKLSGRVAGFALVRKLHCFDMEQFFVLRPYRRQGVGKQAFQHVVTCCPGEWQIRVLPRSRGALLFWMDAALSVASNECRLTREKDDDRSMHFIRFTTR